MENADFREVCKRLAIRRATVESFITELAIRAGEPRNHTAEPFSHEPYTFRRGVPVTGLEKRRWANLTPEQLRIEKTSDPVELTQFAEAVLHLRQRLGLPCE